MEIIFIEREEKNTLKSIQDFQIQLNDNAKQNFKDSFTI